jgi:hypothetical protein
MDPPTTPVLEAREGREPYSTPTKAKIQGVIEYNKAHGIQTFNEDVFRYFGVTHTQGYEILKNHTTNRQAAHTDAISDSCGRPKLISDEKIIEMDCLLQTEGIKARGLTWEQLGTEVGLDICGRMIQRAIGTMDY